MNKNDLVAHVAERPVCRVPMPATPSMRFIDGVTQTLTKGEEVRLVGFGTFAVAARAASEGRNPRTGETIKIAASKQVRFKAGKGLKDSVNSAGGKKK